jgi:pyruvate dehydrogenase (quinone)
MSQTVGEFFVQRLHEWGVRTICGFPGDGINGVLRGLENAKGMIKGALHQAFAGIGSSKEHG